MQISFSKLIEKYKIEPKGVIQIGAHHFEERDEFIKAGIKHFVLIEPQNDAIKVINERINNLECIVFNCAVGTDPNDAGLLYVDDNNKGLSASLLEPKEHLNEFKKITFNKRDLVKVEPLSNLKFNRKKYNIIYMDIQGSELNALMSAEPYFFDHIDAIFTEVNFIEMYKDCALIKEIDYYLNIFDFLRVETFNHKNGQGDALYLKIESY